MGCCAVEAAEAPAEPTTKAPVAAFPSVVPRPPPRAARASTQQPRRAVTSMLQKSLGLLPRAKAPAEEAVPREPTASSPVPPSSAAPGPARSASDEGDGDESSPAAPVWPMPSLHEATSTTSGVHLAMPLPGGGAIVMGGSTGMAHTSAVNAIAAAQLRTTAASPMPGTKAAEISALWEPMAVSRDAGDGPLSTLSPTGSSLRSPPARGVSFGAGSVVAPPAVSMSTSLAERSQHGRWAGDRFLVVLDATGATVRTAQAGKTRVERVVSWLDTVVDAHDAVTSPLAGGDK